MADKLVKLNPVSSTSQPSELGTAGYQKIYIDIAGLTDGSGLATDRSENVFIVDSANHCIFKWKKGWSSRVIYAGGYGVSGQADGQGTAARFNSPGPIAVDRSGNLYVVDAGNNLIRRIDDNARVYTVASIQPTPGGEQIGHIAVDDSGTIFLIMAAP